VSRPREEVFDFIADPEPLVRWTGTNEVRLLDEGPLRAGTRFATVGTYGRGPEDHVYELAAYDPPTSVSMSGRWGSGRWSASVEATIRCEREDHATTVTYDVTLAPRPAWLRLLDAVLGWFFTRIIRRQLVKELGIVKRLLEEPVTPSHR